MQNFKQFLPSSNFLLLLFGIVLYIVGKEYHYDFIKYVGCFITVISAFQYVDDFSSVYDKWRNKK